MVVTMTRENGDDSEIVSLCKEDPSDRVFAICKMVFFRAAAQRKKNWAITCQA